MGKSIDPETWYTARQTADLLRREVTEATVKEYCKKHKLKCKQVGPKKTVDDFGLVDHRTEPEMGPRLVLSCRAPVSAILCNEKKAHMPVKKKRSRVGRARSKSAKTVSLANPRFRALFEKEMRHWEEEVRPLQEAARSSERLTGRDFAIRINARG